MVYSICLALLLVTVVYYLITQTHSSLVMNYKFVPKTIDKKIHLVLSYNKLGKNIDKIITNILNQTERADLMTLIIPMNFTGNLSKLVLDTCVIQISGGYAMLAKEREIGTIFVFVKGNFEDPNILKQMIFDTANNMKDVCRFNDAICVKNSINIGIDETYN